MAKMSEYERIIRSSPSLIAEAEAILDELIPVVDALFARGARAVPLQMAAHDLAILLGKPAPDLFPSRSTVRDPECKGLDGKFHRSEFNE